MRILVTGSRELIHRETVWNELARFAPANKITVVVGYNPETETPSGADKFAYEYVMNHRFHGHTIDVECHPADWNRKCDSNCYHSPRFQPYECPDGSIVLTPYCPAAGNVRNQEMVDSGIDYALGFLKMGAKNRGTLDCLRRVRKAKIRHEKFMEK